MRHEKSEKLTEELKSLGLKKNEESVYVSLGRLQGEGSGTSNTNWPPWAEHSFDDD